MRRWQAESADPLNSGEGKRSMREAGADESQQSAKAQMCIASRILVFLSSLSLLFFFTAPLAPVVLLLRVPEGLLDF